MIEVGVEDRYLHERVALKPQPYPGDHPRQGGIPADRTGPSRLITQPVVTTAQQGESLLVVKNRDELATRLAIVAPNPDPGVARQVVRNLLQLRIQHFLQSKHVGFERLDSLDDTLPPLVPGVETIVRTVIANVETHHPDAVRQLATQRGENG